MIKAVIVAFIAPILFGAAHLFLAPDGSLNLGALVAVLAGGNLGLKMTEGASPFEKVVGVTVFVAIELGYGLFVLAFVDLASTGFD